MSRNADTACPFCIDSNTKKGHAESAIGDGHVAPPLARAQCTNQGLYWLVQRIASWLSLAKCKIEMQLITM